MKSRLALKEKNNIENYNKLNSEALEYFNKSYEIALEKDDGYEMNAIMDNMKELAAENIEPAIEFLKNNNIDYFVATKNQKGCIFLLKIQVLFYTNTYS